MEGTWQSHKRLQKAIEKLQHARKKASMYKSLVEDLHACTGYDRVMVYKFHTDQHGEVVAEYKSPELKESWHGLHFPASDIPQRARELFKTNGVRLIYDAAASPVDLVTCGRPSRSLSLAESTLRAVHPCHAQYLQNMNVRASLSLAIVVQGNLWGLIVCHHYRGPRFIPFQTRTACEFLLQAFSIRITGVLKSEQQARQERKNRIHAIFSEKMSHYPDRETILHGLFGKDANLRHLIPDTCGAAVAFAGRIVPIGEVPDDETVRRIVRWRQAQPGDRPLAVASLAREVPGLDNIGSVVAGALCAPVVDQGMLLWFRPEFAHTIRWAGDPGLGAQPAPGRGMMPRNSFAAFTQSVEGLCEAWTDENLQDAEALARLVDEVLVSADSDVRSSLLEQFRARLLQDRATCKMVVAELGRLVDAADVPVFAAAADGKVVEWNARCAALSGVPREAAVGRRLGELPACGGPLMDALAGAGGDGEARNFRVLLGQHAFLFIMAAERTADGRLLFAVFVGQEAPDAEQFLDADSSFPAT